MQSYGKSVRIVLVIALIVPLLLVLGCGSAPQPKEEAPQSLSGAALVSSNNTWTIGGDLGGVTLAGSGFGQGEELEILIVNAFGNYSFGLGGGKDYVPWATNSSGAFLIAFAKTDTIPTAINPGVYTLQVTGKKSKTIASVPIQLAKK